MIIDQLNADLRTAIKAKDRIGADTLRSVLTAVRNVEVSGDTARTLDDDEILAIISAEAKKRTEASGIYRDNGRVTAAELEEAQHRVLTAYLPAQLDGAELDAVVSRIATAIGAESMADMGRTVAAVRAEVGGSADGRSIADAVKRMLGR